MHTILLISSLLLWLTVLLIGFLLLGTLRSLGLLQWQIDQLELTRPSRINRDGLKPGQTAPDFTLPRVGGGECSLCDFRGQRVFLTFVQAGCQPCHDIAPELSRLQRTEDLQVLVVNRADPDEAAEWASDVRADYPVLVQSGLDVLKKYQVFATPFAFLIDERGVVASSGIVSERRYFGFVLDAAEKRRREQEVVVDDDVGSDANGISKVELEVAEADELLRR